MCSKCGIRPAYRKSGKPGGPYCKECFSEYNRLRANVSFEVIETAKSVPCADCGERYPSYVMDFDHIGVKTRNISKMRNYSLDRLRAEIAQCEVVCSNCHRVRTHDRLVTQRLE